MIASAASRPVCAAPFMKPGQASERCSPANTIGPERAAWLAYLRKSEAMMAADKASFAKEREGLAAIPAPARAGNPNSMPLDRDAAWYGGAEAKAIAANILSYQTPAGGWSKNQNRADPPRQRG